MRLLLRDADGKKENSEMVKNWVEQVRVVAYDVEDIIDEFLYRLERRQHTVASATSYAMLFASQKM